MAACPVCSKEIPPDATACPHCQASVRVFLWVFFWLFLCGGGVAFFPISCVSGGPAPPRMQSINNLKNMALAAANYHEKYHVLPPGCTVNDKGQSLHSWQTLQLMYLDQQAIHLRLNHSVPWEDPRQGEHFKITLNVFRNPKVEQQTLPSGLAISHYAGNSQVLYANSSMTFDDVTDGLSHTLLIGDVNGNFKAWGDPSNIRDPALGINNHPDGFGSPFEGGAHFALLDGSVRFLSDKMEPHVLHALATPNGGETVDEF